MKIETEWEIERILGRLVGEAVLVEVAAVRPSLWSGDLPVRWIPVRDLVMADDLPASGMKVYFHGKLREFAREIGFVYAWLSAPPGVGEELMRSLVTLNGRFVGLMEAAAVVRLAYPFYVVRQPDVGPDDWNEAEVLPNRGKYLH